MPQFIGYDWSQMRNHLRVFTVTVAALALLQAPRASADTVDDLRQRLTAAKKDRQWNQVERYAEALLAAAETTLSGDPKRLLANRKVAALGLSALAGELRDQGRLAEAEAKDKRALDILERAGRPAKQIAVVAASLGKTHRNQKRYAEAIRMYKWSLTTYEQASGKVHEDVELALSKLGHVYVDQGRFAEAEPLFLRAMQISKELHGEYHAKVAWRNYDLGRLYWMSDDDKQALVYFQRALEIRERVLPKDDPLIASSLDDVADAFQHLDQHDQAEKMLRRALGIAERSHGASHPKVARLLDNLADSLVGLKRFREAEQNYQRALTIYEQAKGPMSREAGWVVHSLADLKEAEGQWEDSAKFYERELAIEEALDGAQHPNVAQTLRILAGVYGRLGRATEADDALSRCLDILDAWKGEDSDLVASFLGAAGEALRNNRQGDQGIELYRRSIAMSERLHGAGHAESITVRAEFVAALIRSSPKNYALAESEGVRLLADCRRLFGNDDVRTARAQFHLGDLAYVRGQDRKAEELLLNAYRVQKQCNASDFPETSKFLALLYTHQGRFTEAEAMAREALAIREKQNRSDKSGIPTCLFVLANVLSELARFDEAEEHLRRALALYEKDLRPDHIRVAGIAQALGDLFLQQARFAEAEALFRRALAIHEKWQPRNTYDARASLGGLAAIAAARGAFAESEELRRRVLAAYETEGGRDDISTGYGAAALAHVLAEQNRFAEAEPLLEYDLQIHLASFGEEHKSLIPIHEQRASLFQSQNKLGQAQEAALKAVRIAESIYGKDGYGAATSLAALASVRAEEKQFDDAEALYKRVLAILEKSLPRNHPRLGDTAYCISKMYLDQRRFAEAEPLIDQAIAVAERNSSSFGDRALRYDLRAQIAWEQGRRNEAVADLREAVRHAEQQRAQFAGTETDRAAAFAGMAPIFERMLLWQMELGDVAEAFAAIERGRARSLLDEMSLAGADLEIATPAIEREKHRQQEGALRAQIAALERELTALPKPDAAKSRQLTDALATTREKLFQRYRSERSSNAVYRNSFAAVSAPPRLGQLQRSVLADGGMLLVYFLGRDAACLAVLTNNEARIVRLAINERQASVLGCTPGPLTAQQATAVLLREDGQGVVQQLANAATAEAADEKLKALADVLLPHDCRSELLAKQVKRLFIVPDAGLALLPFEALVLSDDEDRHYLLDYDVPVCYAPSATVLYGLASAKPRFDAVSSVLTVGDPDYPTTPAGPNLAALADLTPRSRYGLLGGALAPLPYSGVESYSVREAFGKKALPVTQLLHGEATEPNVRAAVAGKRVVHLACHGLTDQDFGNYFGALALTPPAMKDPAPEDDGFLTLAEIYSLDMKSCELAILSACQTNFGPQQQGEGVWALSRGFLIAGARRVVATNWLVDDEAAANLVGYFCGTIGKNALQDANTDYALALHAAKRWLREEPKWSSPYYWSSFVLVGPN
ncbi:MAG TPA: tetratricopeptide repeat protein [Pirellulales bacterium]|nr:tetratricopeptide repeat protein [Pirellulales bacterium]